MSDVPDIRPNPELGDFDGKPVVSTSVKVTKAGDGLSAALEVDPQLLHSGQRGAIILEYEVGPIAFKPQKDYGFDRNHTLITQRGTLVDLDTVEKVLDEQSKRIEQAQGIARLPLDGEDGLDAPEQVDGEWELPDPDGDVHVEADVPAEVEEGDDAAE